MFAVAFPTSFIAEPTPPLIVKVEPASTLKSSAVNALPLTNNELAPSINSVTLELFCICSVPIVCAGTLSITETDETVAPITNLSSADGFVLAGVQFAAVV
jgi:hypothetical protein